MNCRRYRHLSDQAVLGLLAPGEQQLLQAHLAHCPACLAELARTQAAVTRFRAACAMAGSTADHATMAGELSLVPAAAPRRRFAAVRARRLLPLAACAAAIVGLAATFWQRGALVRRLNCDCRPWQAEGMLLSRTALTHQPLVVGHRLFALQVIDGELCLAALDRRSGRRRWLVRADFQGEPATDGKRIFAWVRAGRFEPYRMAAFDAASGRERWRAPAPETHQADGEREIVVGGGGVGWTSGATAYWHDAASGRELWRAALPGDDAPDRRMLAGADCLAVVGRRQVSVLDMARGETVWTRGLEWQASSRGAVRAAAGGGLLAIAGAAGPAADRLTCLELRSGTEVWSATSAPVRHLLFREGLLFARGAALTALDGRTGRRRWSLPAAGCSPATFAGDKLYLVAGSGGVVTLDPATGVSLGRARSVSSCGGVTVAGRMGYLRTADGVLRAIRLAGDAPGESERQG